MYLKKNDNTELIYQNQRQWQKYCARMHIQQTKANLPQCSQCLQSPTHQEPEEAYQWPVIQDMIYRSETYSLIEL